MRVEIAVQVELESPLHIGSGSLADSLADKPLLKDSRGLPTIPGSSLKGKARHMAEQIARGLWPAMSVCGAPYPDRMCAGVEHDRLCPICRVFGAPQFPAPVRFGNLSLQLNAGLSAPRDWTHHFEPELRAGVGLSRTQRTAQEDILYTVETYRRSPALAFSGAVTGELIERREAALLVAGLRGIRTLGGNRSRGLGWCQVAPVVCLDGVEQDLAALLKELATWLS